jgi:hypothetical protein
LKIYIQLIEIIKFKNEENTKFLTALSIKCSKKWKLSAKKLTVRTE